MIIYRNAYASFLFFAALGLSAAACSSDGAPASPGTGGTGGESTGGNTSKGGSGGGTTGSGGSGTGGKSGSSPTIKITDPIAAETVGPTAEYPDYPDVPVQFTTTGFTLKAPGTCAGAPSCGHIHLLVDGSACNDVANKAPYNAAGAASPINAGLDYCPNIEGQHTITLEIHNDDHSPVKGADGKVISDSIQITAQPEASVRDAGADAKAP
jgi:hypothetical protein